MAEQQLRPTDGYMGNIRLKRVGVDISYSEEQVAELVKCSKDPVYFIKNFVHIFVLLKTTREVQFSFFLLK